MEFNLKTLFKEIKEHKHTHVKQIHTWTVFILYVLVGHRFLGAPSLPLTVCKFAKIEGSENIFCSMTYPGL